MTNRLSMLGLLLLVGVLVLGGLSGCSRSADLREPSQAEAADDQQAPVAPDDMGLAPTTGVVVSVMTPTTATRVEPVTGSEDSEVASPVPIVDGTPEGGPTATAVLEPTAQPVPTDEPADDSGTTTVWHTVQRGETLSLIASRYGSTVNAIVRANNLSNPNQIIVGQRLKIPTGDTSGGSSPGCRFRHTVRSGEWIWQIAREYGVSPYDILSANGLTVQTGQNIMPGRVLCIP